MAISVRKLESYKRAEVVAQSVRKYVSAGPRATQDDLDKMMDSLLDWLSVSGNCGYQKPIRRGRKKHN